MSQGWILLQHRTPQRRCQRSFLCRYAYIYIYMCARSVPGTCGRLPTVPNRPFLDCFGSLLFLWEGHPGPHFPALPIRCVGAFPMSSFGIRCRGSTIPTTSWRMAPAWPLGQNRAVGKRCAEGSRSGDWLASQLCRVIQAPRVAFSVFLSGHG